MDNFDLRKYLAEGKLNENLQIDDLFGEYVAQWSQGNYDYDFAELKPGPIKGSLVDDFTLGPDEYDDDDYVRDYKMMRDYLLKNKSYELSKDSSIGLSYNHISNASLGDKNPGANSYMFNFLKNF